MIEVAVRSVEPKVYARVNGRISFKRGEEIVEKVYQMEGVPEMSQAEADVLRGVLGDERAEVAVSRDIGNKVFGTGGGVMVTITVRCNQDAMSVYRAGELANQMAQNMLDKYYPMMVDHCRQHGAVEVRR